MSRRKNAFQYFQILGGIIGWAMAFLRRAIVINRNIKGQGITHSSYGTLLRLKILLEVVCCSYNVVPSMRSGVKKNHAIFRDVLVKIK